MKLLPFLLVSTTIHLAAMAVPLGEAPSMEYKLASQPPKTTEYKPLEVTIIPDTDVLITNTRQDSDFEWTGLMDIPTQSCDWPRNFTPE